MLDESETSKVELELGGFINSYNDPTVCLSVSTLWRVSEFIDCGIDVRHWETANQTYEKRAISVYNRLNLKFFKNTAIDILIRRSGPIFSLKRSF